jgi:HEPN domain-containing protein
LVSRFSDWIRQAKRNLASSHVNMKEGLHEEACFEAHQAGEKALKGLLNLLHKERRGHSLAFIVSELGIDVPEEIKECALMLDKHYILTMYPDVFDEGAPMDYYTRGDAEKCISCAEKILNWVEEFAGRTQKAS